ncbi:hypothetical protein LINPERHAP2_LOCUS14125 [Linum perenne]
MLQMSKKIFWNLCDLLESAGGLKRSRNMKVHEMVAIFLVAVGHNIKNRTCQIIFHRSGETVSRTIHCVLQALLNLHGYLGALDGTINTVRTSTTSHARYWT